MTTFIDILNENLNQLNGLKERDDIIESSPSLGFSNEAMVSLTRYFIMWRTELNESKTIERLNGADTRQLDDNTLLNMELSENWKRLFTNAAEWSSHYFAKQLLDKYSDDYNNELVEAAKGIEINEYGDMVCIPEKECYCFGACNHGLDIDIDELVDEYELLELETFQLMVIELFSKLIPATRLNNDKWLIFDAGAEFWDLREYQQEEA